MYFVYYSTVHAKQVCLVLNMPVYYHEDPLLNYQTTKKGGKNAPGFV